DLLGRAGQQGARPSRCAASHEHIDEGDGGRAGQTTRPAQDTNRALGQLHEWGNHVRKQRGHNQYEDNGREPVQPPEAEGHSKNDEDYLQDDARLRGRGHALFFSRRRMDAVLSRGKSSRNDAMPFYRTWLLEFCGAGQFIHDTPAPVPYAYVRTRGVHKRTALGSCPFSMLVRVEYETTVLGLVRCRPLLRAEALSPAGDFTGAIAPGCTATRSPSCWC